MGARAAAVALSVAASFLAGRAYADGPRKHHVDAAFSAAGVIDDCNCDGRFSFNLREGGGGRVGYRYELLPWLGVGVAPSLHFHQKGRSLFVPLSLMPGWTFRGESAAWFLLGGGVAHLAATGSQDATMVAPFLRFGGGGAAHVTENLSLFFELGLLLGKGEANVKRGIGGPGGFSATDAFAGGTLDLGARWGL